MNDIYARDLGGDMVSPDDPGYDALVADIFSCMETAQELASVSVRDQKRVHELMEIILSKQLPESTTVLPPLYIDYGKPVTIGERCFTALSSVAEESPSATVCSSVRNAT